MQYVTMYIDNEPIICEKEVFFSVRIHEKMKIEQINVRSLESKFLFVGEVPRVSVHFLIYHFMISFRYSIDFPERHWRSIG